MAHQWLSQNASDLYFATNGASFDFPKYTRDPSLIYVISSSARSGSNMLQRALWRTNRAGAPEEYLTPKYVADFAGRWGDLGGASSEQVDVERYIGHLFRHRTSPNGVFGVKLHGDHLSQRLLAGYDLHVLLRHPRYIWLRRRDRVRQAISYMLAEHTGVWIRDGKWLADKEPNPTPARYDADLIGKYIRALDREEMVWSDYFVTYSVEPHEIYYEDLAEEFQETMRLCLEYLDVEPLEKFPDPGIRKQADHLNDEWYERFCSDRRIEAV